MKISTLSLAAKLAMSSALLVGAAAASAAACTGVSVNNADTTDVTLNAVASDACVVAIGNAQSGPNGDPSLFDGTFGGGWSLLSKVNEGGTFDSPNPVTLNGVTFTIGFTQTDSDTGTWSIQASQNVTMDLVFAMHAGGRTGSFLFDNKAIAGTAPGTWEIDWVNNGNREPGYSNLTLFARDITTQVPEPETYALMLAGLGIVGMVARRRRPAR